MSLIAKIYYLTKTLDDLEIKISEYEIAQSLEEDAYGRLWYEEKIEQLNKKIKRTKLLLIDLVKEL